MKPNWNRWLIFSIYIISIARFVFLIFYLLFYFCVCVFACIHLVSNSFAFILAVAFVSSSLAVGERVRVCTNKLFLLQRKDKTELKSRVLSSCACICTFPKKRLLIKCLLHEIPWKNAFAYK